MDTVNIDLVERQGVLSAMLSGALCGPVTGEGMARSDKGGRESGADSVRFQRFEAGRQASAKTASKRVTIGGDLYYADKPCGRQRPRPISPELREFYIEQSKIENKKQGKKRK